MTNSENQIRIKPTACATVTICWNAIQFTSTPTIGKLSSAKVATEAFVVVKPL
ncbi:hypothetical protein D1872_316910 [compost metagenome]